METNVPLGAQWNVLPHHIRAYTSTSTPSTSIRLAATATVFLAFAKMKSIVKRWIEEEDETEWMS